MDKNYLTIKDVAKLLNVTPLTLRNWDKRGKLIAYRHPINNYRVYKKEDLEVFLRKLESSKSADIISPQKLTALTPKKLKVNTAN